MSTQEAGLSCGRDMEQTRLSCGQYDYDLLVIGGGSGGLAVSKEAAGFGRRVLVLDLVAPTPEVTKWRLGGSSVNVGSIPRKILHQASLLGKAIQDARKYGWKFEEQGSHGWGEMVDTVQQHVKSVSFELRRELRDSDVTYLNAHGEIQEPHTGQVYHSYYRPLEWTVPRRDKMLC
ncbi:thioredoxin reductase 1, cytoplasmic isoform X2 [Salmo salar]|uniref:Thioredoxin reductase 1, cytoplasmic isoform X2 n=1 Tax=Salmo salar TaxID=8030 RepID=A0A1S3SH10_SALSA|nr:thioredoxin reductase 1, cytoplasmic-like isoform X2 [Salmo salar]